MHASCQCGQLKATIADEAARLAARVMCHCKACQRRTGSPFGMLVYFPREAVTLSGKTTEYTRRADSGDESTHGFCPTCGTPLWLVTAKHPAGIGIASGAFDGSDIAPPHRSVFEENRHEWVAVPDGTQRFARGRKG
ncbi:GFA family protein [Alteriqipengyuania sp. 357]